MPETRFATVAIDEKGGITYRDLVTTQISPPAARSNMPPPIQGPYAHEAKRVSGKIQVSPTSKDHLIGNAALALDAPGSVFISGAVSFQPTEHNVQWIGLNVVATHANGTVVNSSNGKMANYQGAVAGTYTSIQRSAVLKLPHAGDWTIQLAAHKTKDGVTMKVHTYNISAYPIGE